MRRKLHPERNNTTQCMNCIALNRLIGFTNLCMEENMPAWTNRVKNEGRKYDCLDCPYLMDENCPEKDTMRVVKQISCNYHWDKAMAQALDAAVEKMLDRPVCYEAVFDNDGYYCTRGNHPCEHQYPNSATCTHMPNLGCMAPGTVSPVRGVIAFSAQETTPEIHADQAQRWFDECKRDPEVPDMLLTREPLFDWKTLGVDVTVEHDRIAQVHNSIPKGATLAYREGHVFFLTRRWAAWHLFKEVFVHIGRMFQVIFTGRCK